MNDHPTRIWFPGWKRPAEGWESLTTTENKVVELVCEGLTNPQIADRLSVSPRTIQTHMKNIFKKIEVRTRTELVAQAVRREKEEG